VVSYCARLLLLLFGHAAHIQHIVAPVHAPPTAPHVALCARSGSIRRRAGRQLASVASLAAHTGAAGWHTPDEHLSQVSSELAVNVLLRARQLQVHVGVHGHKVACNRHALSRTKRSEPQRCMHTQSSAHTT